MALNFWLKRSKKQCQNPCSGHPSVYQDLFTRHDMPVKKAIVNLPTRSRGLKRNFKCTSGNSKILALLYRHN